MNKSIKIISITFLFLLLVVIVAKEYNFELVNNDSNILLADSNSIRGDINGDNKVTTADCLLIKKNLLRVKDLTNAQKKLADLNGDGKVTIQDYMELKKIILNGGKSDVPEYQSEGILHQYSDATASLTIEKIKYNSRINGKSTIYYQVHLILSDYSRLYTGVANPTKKKSDGKYAGGKISSAANKVGAILAIEGDYAVNGRTNKICGLKGAIRNGVLMSPNTIDLASLPASSVGYGYYSKKTGVFGSRNDLKLANLQIALDTQEVTDSFCFGPDLVVNGSNVRTSEKDKTNRPRQATFIGYIKPGEFYFIVSEGIAYSDEEPYIPSRDDKPSDGTSYGLTRYEKGKILEDLGCTYGTSMDGGASIILYFQGKQLQSRKEIKQERDWLLDFVYFK